VHNGIIRQLVMLFTHKKFLHNVEHHAVSLWHLVWINVYYYYSERHHVSWLITHKNVN